MSLNTNGMKVIYPDGVGKKKPVETGIKYNLKEEYDRNKTGKDITSSWINRDVFYSIFVLSSLMKFRKAFCIYPFYLQPITINITISIRCVYVFVTFISYFMQFVLFNISYFVFSRYRAFNAFIRIRKSICLRSVLGQYEWNESNISGWCWEEKTKRL